MTDNNAKSVKSTPPLIRIRRVAVAVTASDTIVVVAVDDEGCAWKLIGTKWTKLPELPQS